ncbi:hypothetical protein HHI36_002484 [Cryptolaemus montrouzieri]|uniref:Uncharacterized protein n=1 Tax=Cryptolaemus montrouzieri TaxID=559131 RepID=A0ABD2PB77_9CUCU
MKTMTLVKIGAIGGILTCSMGMALQYKLSNNVKQTEFYKESMNLVRHNKAAIHFLGEPIKDATIEMVNSNVNYLTDTEGKYEVKLKGSKQKGKLYIYIKKEKNEGIQNFKLDHVELELKNQPDKRLLIRNEKHNDEYPQF